jgi:hypothetical protein
MPPWQYVFEEVFVDVEYRTHGRQLLVYLVAIDSYVVSKFLPLTPKMAPDKGGAFNLQLGPIISVISSCRSPK